MKSQNNFSYAKLKIAVEEISGDIQLAKEERRGNRTSVDDKRERDKDKGKERDKKKDNHERERSEIR